MSLPTLNKSWEYSFNNAYGPQGTWLANQRNIWFNIVSFLKSKGWTVQAASIGSGTPSTTSDWTTASNLNWGQRPSSTNPIAFSWIVLRNSVIGSTFDICLEFSTGSNPSGGQNYFSITGSYSLYVSPGGYNVGGALSLTARPSTTNGDEIALKTDSMLSTNNVDNPYVWHGWSSTDRECTRIFIYQNDLIIGILVLDKVKNPTPGWTNPFVATFQASSSGGMTLQSGWTSAIMSTRHNSSNYTTYLSCESITGQPAYLSQPNDLSREYAILPIGVVSTTSPFRGHHGYMSDAWWTIPSKNGMLFPDSTSKSFSLHGGMVLPWDGTSLVKTR